MPHGFLAGRRAVQHLVAELGTVAAAALRGQAREDILDLAREPRHELGLEDAPQHCVAVALELHARCRGSARVNR